MKRNCQEKEHPRHPRRRNTNSPESATDWMEYRREGAAVVNITEVTLAALTTAWTTGGFLEIGHGLYRLDVPDAAFATGANTLSIQGTVTGMITAFNSIALNGTGDAGILAKGISEALYTTAGGLFVAIPCMIFYNYFNKRIDLVVADIEKTCTELLNYFRE